MVGLAKVAFNFCEDCTFWRPGERLESLAAREMVLRVLSGVPSNLAGGFDFWWGPASEGIAERGRVAMSGCSADLRNDA